MERLTFLKEYTLHSLNYNLLNEHNTIVLEITT